MVLCFFEIHANILKKLILPFSYLTIIHGVQCVFLQVWTTSYIVQCSRDVVFLQICKLCSGVFQQKTHY